MQVTDHKFRGNFPKWEMDSKGGGEIPEMGHEEWMKAFMRIKEMVDDMYYKI